MVSRHNLQTPSCRYVHVQRWTEEQERKGIPFAAIQFAIKMLPFSRQFTELCDLDLSILPGVSAPRLDLWQQMWSSPRTMWDEALKVVQSSVYPIVEASQNDSGEVLSQAMIEKEIENTLREFSACSPRRQQAALRWLQMQERQEEKDFRDNFDSLIEHGDEFEEINSEADIQELIPLIFLFKIYLPCLGQFGLPPHLIYESARQGDRQALARILAIDPATENFPEINQVCWTYSKARNPIFSRTDQIKRMLSIGLNRNTCKVLAIAWCREWSRLLIQPLRVMGQRRSSHKTPSPSRKPFTIPQLRALFDAYAKDHGRLVDEDLQTDGDALRKMVSRLEKQIPLRCWDIFCPEYVPMN